MFYSSYNPHPIPVDSGESVIKKEGEGPGWAGWNIHLHFISASHLELPRAKDFFWKNVFED